MNLRLVKLHLKYQILHQSHLKNQVSSAKMNSDRPFVVIFFSRCVCVCVYVCYVLEMEQTDKETNWGS